MAATLEEPDMRQVTAPTLAVLLAFGLAMSMNLAAHAAMTVTPFGMTGMEIHLKTDTKNLPSGDVIDPI
jgi:hypothetical protein